MLKADVCQQEIEVKKGRSSRLKYLLLLSLQLDREIRKSMLVEANEEEKSVQE